MQSVAVFVALIAAASATSIYRIPQLDSAVINSQRLGGNFAYSTVENQALGVSSPVVSYVSSPVVSSGLVRNVVNGQQLTYGVPVSGLSNVAVNGQHLAYSVQPASSIVAAGTPASTYKTLAGVSPINTLSYSNLNGVVGVNGLGYSTLSGINGINGINNVYGYGLGQVGQLGQLGQIVV